MTRPFPLHTGMAEVTAVTEVTPTMARFTLTAPAFADFGVEEPGQIITLGWCDEGEELVLPLRRWRFPKGTREQHWRNYTVRAYRPERAEVDVDFFLHGDAGRAAAWAERAQPGDCVCFAGGGHSPAMKQVRDHVRAQRTFARGAVQVLGYW